MNEAVALWLLEEAEREAAKAEAEFDELVDSLPLAPRGRRADACLPDQTVYTFEELIQFAAAARDGRPE